MNLFQRELKDSYRLVVRQEKPSLTVSLFNIQNDTFYSQTYTDDSLPKSIRQHAPTVEQVFHFIKNLTKFYEVRSPGEIVMHHKRVLYYKLKHEKKEIFIKFVLKKMELNLEPDLGDYLHMLKKELFDLKNTYDQNGRIIRYNQFRIKHMQIELQELEKEKEIIDRKNNQNTEGDTTNRKRRNRNSKKKGGQQINCMRKDPNYISYSSKLLNGHHDFLAGGKAYRSGLNQQSVVPPIRANRPRNYQIDQ